MHRSPRSLMLLLVVMTLLMTACANDDGGDDGEAETADATAAATDATEAAPTSTEVADATPTTSAPSEAAAGEGTEAEAGEGTEAEAGDGNPPRTIDQACEAYGDVEIPEDFNVGLVTDIGRIDDGTFTQFAYEGMTSAAECLEFPTDFIETTSEADYRENIETILVGEPEVVVTVGFLMADVTLEAAAANPDIDFIGIDQFHESYPENYVGILFREDQGGFLAGTMAALLTESDTIGVVGGLETVPPVVRYVNGFQAGAESVNPDINVLSVYTDSFTDPAQGQSTALQFLGEGADVIFGAGGQTGSGAVQAAAEAGAWGIGVDQDEYFTTFGGGSSPGADRLATSAVKRVDLGVFVQIGEALRGTIESGVFTLEAANGGITYSPFHDADIPDDVEPQMEETLAGLVDGSIETGIDPATGLPQ